jgi:hydroxymethylpyrimidine pyrophosphatase-like HAD family hydrolase
MRAFRVGRLCLAVARPLLVSFRRILACGVSGTAAAGLQWDVPIRLIAIDIDGTLLDSKFKVPEANRRAISEAVDRGIEVALVTGRRFDFAKPIAEEVGCPLTMIVNNGALVKSSDGITRLRHLLPAATALDVLQTTQQYRTGTAVVFDRPRAEQVIYEHVDWNDPLRRGYYERNREYIAEMSPLEACVTEDPIVVMYLGSVNVMREAATVLRSLATKLPTPGAASGAPAMAPIECRFSLAVTEYPARDFAMLDVAHPAVSKGATLAEWAALRGYHRDETMAIGDNHNDREMLEFAGLPVIMANCVDELKTTGWRETLSNDEAGVAAAIEAYALGGAR